MPVFLRLFPLKDDSASVSKPRRPAERLREVRWQEDQTLDRLLIVADFGDGTSTIGSVGRARRPPGLSRVRKTRLGAMMSFFVTSNIVLVRRADPVQARR